MMIFCKNCGTFSRAIAIAIVLITASYKISRILRAILVKQNPIPIMQVRCLVTDIVTDFFNL